ncbi:hypothetical protein E2C01_093371 [Portunus trituberculatus]|uniref:Uncharacterized protein n=1 Tax=Portunus trituberculatus TaxID=210409 RepID=A0A5B7JIS9_PORTR|nr:hypothetical protein [Portunus trituberculatus]
MCRQTGQDTRGCTREVTPGGGSTLTHLLIPSILFGCCLEGLDHMYRSPEGSTVGVSGRVVVVQWAWRGKHFTLR